VLLFGRVIGLVWYYLFPIRRRVSLENVRRVFGDELTPREQRRLVRRCFERLGMYVMEVLRLPKLTAKLSEALVEQRGFEHMEAALARGKGVILVASHMDNVDLAGCSMSIRGLPLCVVAKTVEWKPAGDFVTAIRERTGVRLIPTKRSKDQIRALLKENKVVTLVVDQHIKKRHSIVCEFFGQLASTSHAPARLAMETGAALITGLMFRQGWSGRHVARMDPEFQIERPHGDPARDARHNTERLNRVIEGWIREHPEQWLWPHRRWKVQDNPAGWDIPPELQHLAVGQTPNAR